MMNVSDHEFNKSGWEKLAGHKNYTYNPHYHQTLHPHILPFVSSLKFPNKDIIIIYFLDLSKCELTVYGGLRWRWNIHATVYSIHKKEY